MKGFMDDTTFVQWRDQQSADAGVTHTLLPSSPPYPTGFLSARRSTSWWGWVQPSPVMLGGKNLTIVRTHKYISIGDDLLFTKCKL